jgi:hypothetical protein
MDKQILQGFLAYCGMKYGSLALQQYFNWYNKRPVEFDYSEIEKWLLSINPSINIHSKINDEAFRFACIHGHLNIARWLLSVDTDIV